MNNPTSATANRAWVPQAASHKPQAGFTMTELLVVIAIIVALTAILIPAIGAARNAARAAAIHTFGGTIATALSAYEQDYKELPPSYAGAPPLAYAPVAADWDGGEILAQALLGPLGDPDGDKQPDLTGVTPDDGMNGFGFRSATGKESGPYLELKNDKNIRARWDKTNVGLLDADELWDDSVIPGSSPAKTTLLSRNNAYVLTLSSGTGAPFLYYKANNAAPGRGANFKSDDAVWDDDSDDTGLGSYSRFNAADNDDLARVVMVSGKYTGRDALARWKHVKYGTGSTDPAALQNRDMFAASLRSADYLIVHPGPDGLFGVWTEDTVFPDTDAGRALEKDRYEQWQPSDDDIFITGQRTK